MPSQRRADPKPTEVRGRKADCYDILCVSSCEFLLTHITGGFKHEMSSECALENKLKRDLPVVYMLFSLISVRIMHLKVRVGYTGI